jgi:hypothetical protein
VEEVVSRQGGRVGNVAKDTSSEFAVPMHTLSKKASYDPQTPDHPSEGHHILRRLPLPMQYQPLHFHKNDRSIAQHRKKKKRAVLFVDVAGAHLSLFFFVFLSSIYSNNGKKKNGKTRNRHKKEELKNDTTGQNPVQR